MHKDSPILNLLGIPPIQIGREPLLGTLYPANWRLRPVVGQHCYFVKQQGEPDGPTAHAKGKTKEARLYAILSEATAAGYLDGAKTERIGGRVSRKLV